MTLPILHTTSSLRTWDTCKRKYQIEYVRRVRPASRGKALGVGTATHDGLERFMLGDTLGGILARVEETTRGPAWENEKAQIEWGRVRAMLAAYFATWSAARANWEPVEVEGSFQIATGTSMLAGKRDALMRHKPTGKLYLWEHKTASEDIDNVGTDYWQRLLLDRQLAIYQHDAAERFGEVPAVLYDVIRKPGGSPRLKSRKKDATERESLAEFGERMAQTMLEDPGKYLVRREVHRTREEVAEVLAEMTETAGEIDAYRGRYPRNDNACKARYGICPFLGVCAGIDTLDSDKFVTLDETHPELGQTQTSEDADDSYSAEELPF